MKPRSVVCNALLIVAGVQTAENRVTVRPDDTGGIAWGPFPSDEGG